MLRINIERHRVSERDSREKVNDRRYVDRYIEFYRSEIGREGVGVGVGIKYCGGGANLREEEMLG